MSRAERTDRRASARGCRSPRGMEQMLVRPGAPPGRVLQVCFPSARASILENLNRQREEGHLCDLSIQVQGHVFRAHRCVLAASSPYFHDQVLLKNVSTVSLPSVMDPMAFESVLNSAYTGQLSIVRDDIINYVTVASFLQMWHIVDKCTDILKRSRPLAQVSPSGGAAPTAASSSHQSPSSSDCCAAEPEDAPEKKLHSALPPLATWRRPQQSRWGRAGLTFPLRTEPECGPNAAVTPLLASGGAPDTDFTARNRIRVRLRGAKEDEEQRRMEADEGVGELVEEEEEEEEDRVRVKSEEHQAGGGESDRHLGESESSEMDGLWHSISEWASCAPSDGKLDEEDGELTFDACDDAAGLGLEPPSSPHSPLSATPKVHLCHCGKVFTLKSMRDRHVKMQHLNLRPFACPVCSKSFKMKHHLTKHAKTHGGLRPYECALCGKKIFWRDSFLKHQFRCQRASASTSAPPSDSQRDDADTPGHVKLERDEPSLQEEEMHF